MSDDIFRVQNYYRTFSHCSLPAAFAPLKDDEIRALAEGLTSGEAVENAQKRIYSAMHQFGGKRFVSTDFAAPTDSPRFLSSKKGSVVSVASAWFSLASSAKIRKLAQEGKVSCVCVRAFRKFDVPREFRLFVKDGELKAMSQRFLVRHFRRLVYLQGEYWKNAQDFVAGIKDLLPAKDLVLDIYITSRRQVVLIDINPWGAPTNPLMLNNWDRDLSKPLGCLIVPPPHMLSGDVNVSF